MSNGNKTLFFLAACFFFMSGSSVHAFGQGGSLPARSEIPEEFKWRLEDIYASDARWEEDFESVKKKLPELAAYAGKLGDSPEVLERFLRLRDETSITLEKLYIYAHMRSHEDTAVSKYQALTSRISSLAVEYSAATSFATPELLEIPEQKLLNWADTKPGLAEYRFPLREVVRQKAHILSKPEEALLARAGEIARSPSNTFSMLANADLKFPTVRDGSGKKVELSEERASKLLTSSSRSVRRAAYEGLYSTYGKWRNTLGSTFGGMLRTSRFYSSARKYPSDLAAALDGDNVPEAVYGNLIETVESRLDLLHRYVSLRKKILGLETLGASDLFVPLVRSPYKDIPWDQAKKMVLEALHPLGQTYVADLEKAFGEGWIDVYENQGKRSGAYSWGSYGTHPYVLLNYNGEFNDVSTLAHEMGHSMHSFYSKKAQPPATADYSIFVAEVASTTNEMLLSEHLLEAARKKNDTKKRIYLLNQRLESIRGTLFTQTLFASFERIVHGRFARGEGTTPDDLSKIWRDLRTKYYGPELVLEAVDDIGWARIPHFYTPFYVYQYATGISAAASFARQILGEGENARSRYLTFLGSGGSDYPIEILKKAGVDLSSPKPIADCLDLFEKTLGEMEALLAK